MKQNVGWHIKRGNIIVTGGLITIMALFAYVNVWQNAIYMNKSGCVSLCVADFIVKNSSMFNSNILLFAVILADVMINSKNDFRYSNLIMNGSRIKILNRQTTKIVCHAVIYGLVYVFCTIIFSLNYTSTLINWDKEISYFAYVNKMIKDISYTKIMLFFIAGSILFIITVEIIYLGFFWLIQKEAFVWIILFAVRFADRRYLNGILSMDLSYENILKELMQQQFLISVAVIILVYLIDRLLAERREFYFERK